MTVEIPRYFSRGKGSCPQTRTISRSGCPNDTMHLKQGVAFPEKTCKHVDYCCSSKLPSPNGGNYQSIIIQPLCRKKRHSTSTRDRVQFDGCVARIKAPHTVQNVVQAQRVQTFMNLLLVTVEVSYATLYVKVSKF